MMFIDISVGLSRGMLTFPGNPSVSILPASRIRRGDAVNISEMRMGTHAGTHIDAPLHFGKGADVSQLPLRRLIGECYVADFSSLEHEVTMKDLRPKERLFKNRILLLKTRNSNLLRDAVFHPDYVHLTMDAAEYLVEQGVRLVGIDYLSIERYKGDGAVHRILLEEGIPIVETLDLTGVEEGNYFFIFLPLKILGGDGAPGRAVLMEKNEEGDLNGG